MWKLMMKDKKCKIIFIHTGLKKNGYYHASWIIVDKVKKVVEFFDPHGSSTFQPNCPERFMNIFQKNKRY